MIRTLIQVILMYLSWQFHYFFLCLLVVVAIPACENHQCYFCSGFSSHCKMPPCQKRLKWHTMIQTPGRCSEMFGFQTKITDMLRDFCCTKLGWLCRHRHQTWSRFQTFVETELLRLNSQAGNCKVFAWQTGGFCRGNRQKLLQLAI